MPELRNQDRPSRGEEWASAMFGGTSRSGLAIASSLVDRIVVVRNLAANSRRGHRPLPNCVGHRCHGHNQVVPTRIGLRMGNLFGHAWRPIYRSSSTNGHPWPAVRGGRNWKDSLRDGFGSGRQHAPFPLNDGQPATNRNISYSSLLDNNALKFDNGQRLIQEPDS
jgi:hypothetical protein